MALTPFGSGPVESTITTHPAPLPGPPPTTALFWADPDWLAPEREPETPFFFSSPFPPPSPRAARLERWSASALPHPTPTPPSAGPPPRQSLAARDRSGICVESDNTAFSPRVSLQAGPVADVELPPPGLVFRSPVRPTERWEFVRPTPTIFAGAAALPGDGSTSSPSPQGWSGHVTVTQFQEYPPRP